MTRRRRGTGRNRAAPRLRALELEDGVAVKTTRTRQQPPVWQDGGLTPTQPRFGRFAP